MRLVSSVVTPFREKKNEVWQPEGTVLGTPMGSEPCAALSREMRSCSALGVLERRSSHPHHFGSSHFEKSNTVFPFFSLLHPPHCDGPQRMDRFGCAFGVDPVLNNGHPRSAARQLRRLWDNVSSARHRLQFARNSFVCRQTRSPPWHSRGS